MLNFTEAKFSPESLTSIYADCIKEVKDTPDISPLELFQDKIMENSLGHVVDHFSQLAALIDDMPIAYEEDPSITLNTVCTQITARATEDGLILPVLVEVDG